MIVSPFNQRIGRSKQWNHHRSSTWLQRLVGWSRLLPERGGTTARGGITAVQLHGMHRNKSLRKTRAKTAGVEQKESRPERASGPRSRWSCSRLSRRSHIGEQLTPSHAQPGPIEPLWLSPGEHVSIVIGGRLISHGRSREPRRRLTRTHTARLKNPSSQAAPLWLWQSVWRHRRGESLRTQDWQRRLGLSRPVQRHPGATSQCRWLMAHRSNGNSTTAQLSATSRSAIPAR